MASFRERLARGFTLTFEVDPPKGVEFARILDNVAPMIEAFDGVMVADCTFATLRMSNLAFAQIVRARFGVSVIMHQTARDHNLLGMASHLMGAWSLGVDNLLLMTGDPPRFGTFPDCTPVYDLNSIKLVDLVRRMNEGDVMIDKSNRMKGRTDFMIGVVANPYVPNLRAEVDRLRKKAAMGAHFVVTQPVFDMRTAERFLDYAKDVRIKKIIGVMAIKSYQNALNIASLSPDIFIPVEVYERMRASDTPEQGIAIAKDFVRAVKPMVDGIHLFPLHRYSILPEFLEFKENR